ncbi:MAG: Lrp/AsnC family transcriptional regulator [Salinisphaera sp.]|uniref:Lrp/AsnC family transcriptional regulator n=1 Tax=Salinisphaera sp. TaxID=1914330 RepID=UPI003C7AF58D
MDELDRRILDLLIEDGRLSFAEIGRRLAISRAHARDRTASLQSRGVIEQFTAVVNPEKVGVGISAFVDAKVAPTLVETLCAELATLSEVVSLYLMSDMRSLHIHTLTHTEADLDAFVREHFFAREGVLSIDCTLLLRRIKNRRGGPRI